MWTKPSHISHRVPVYPANRYGLLPISPHFWRYIHLEFWTPRYHVAYIYPIIIFFCFLFPALWRKKPRFDEVPIFAGDNSIRYTSPLYTICIHIVSQGNSIPSCWLYILWCYVVHFCWVNIVFGKKITLL